MKKIVLSLLAVMAFSQFAMAQDQAPRRPMSPPSPEQMVDMRIKEMTSQLDLTPVQQEKIRKILEKQVKEEMKAQEKVEKKRAQAEEKIAKELTPEQRAKFSESRPTAGHMKGGPRRGQGRPDVNGRPHDGPRRGHGHGHDGPRPDGPRPDGFRPDGPHPEAPMPKPEDAPVAP